MEWLELIPTTKGEIILWVMLFSGLYYMADRYNSVISRKFH